MFPDAAPTRRQILQSAAASTCAALIASNAHGQSDDIRIGQSIMLSGPLAPAAANVLKGQELALQEVNRRGGIAGRKVRLISLDDAFDGKRCEDNVLRLIDDEKVIALSGLASSQGIAGALPLLQEKKVPLVGVYTGSPSLRAKHHPFFFTTMASHRDEVVQIARNLRVLQYSRVALVYSNGAFSQLMAPIAEAAAQEAGLSVVVKVALDVNGSDSEQAARKVAELGPQAIIFLSFGPSVPNFVKAARNSIGVPIYCLAIANSKQTMAALGDDARGLAFTQTVPYPWREITTLQRSFHALMNAAKIPVDYDHWVGYLNLRVLLEAMHRSAKNLTPTGIVTALEGMRNIDLGGYVVDFSPSNHHGSKFVEITVMGPGGRFIR